jgi:hypothetical protein
LQEVARERGAFMYTDSFLGRCTIHTLGALSPLFGLIRLAYYTITGVSLFFVAFVAAQNPSRINTYGYLVLSVIIVVSVLGLFEFFMQYNILYSRIFDLSNPSYAQFTSEQYIHRISSTLGHPVYLGCLLVLFFPFFWYALDVSQKNYSRALLVLSSLTVFCTIFLTFSRGSWIALSFSLLFYYRSQRKRLLSILICGVVIVMVMLSVPQIRQLAGERNTYKAYSREAEIGGRIHSYKVVNAMIHESPLWGVGAAHYRFMSGKYGDYDGTPDNAYLMLIAEGGLGCFAIFVVVILNISRTLRKPSSCQSGLPSGRTAFDPQIMDAYAASLLGFLVNSIFCDTFHFAVTRMMFWTIIGHGVGTAFLFGNNQRNCFKTLFEAKGN